MFFLPLKQWLKTKFLSSRNNHQTQALRAAATSVAASGLPFRVPGFREVEGLWVELVLQGHRDWLVQKQPGGWVAEATITVHSQVWVVLGDPRSRSAQQQPSLRPLASSSTRSQARRSSKRTCLLWIDLDAFFLLHYLTECPLRHQLHVQLKLF